MTTPEDAVMTIKDLLAVIHRDGGQYTATHGLKKSYEAAVNKILNAFDAAIEEDKE